MIEGNRSLKGKVVVVTGASAGVGRATARAFAREGAWVGLIARDRKRLEAARSEVLALGSEGLVVIADVADADAMDQAAARLEDELGPIDVWVNSAMASVLAPFAQVNADEFRRVTEVTYLGNVNGTRAALARMLSRDRGTIVQVGSALAYRGIPLQAAYCGAKHALRGFVDSLRCEMLHDRSRIRMTMVQLPALNTPQFSWVKSRLPRKPQPVPPIFRPEVAAEAIYWAAHHDRPEVIVGWPAAKAIAGNKIAPRLADWYLARNGYHAQQTDEADMPGRADNLWEPLPGDHGARGDFSDRAKGYSIYWWLSKNRGWLALSGFGAAAAVLSRLRCSRD